MELFGARLERKQPSHCLPHSKIWDCVAFPPQTPPWFTRPLAAPPPLGHRPAHPLGIHPPCVPTGVRPPTSLHATHPRACLLVRRQGLCAVSTEFHCFLAWYWEQPSPRTSGMGRRACASSIYSPAFLPSRGRTAHIETQSLRTRRGHARNGRAIHDPAASGGTHPGITAQTVGRPRMHVGSRPFGTHGAAPWAPPPGAAVKQSHPFLGPMLALRDMGSSSRHRLCGCPFLIVSTRHGNERCARRQAAQGVRTPMPLPPGT